MNTLALAHSLCHTAWLTGWLLVLPALAILAMCRRLARERLQRGTIGGESSHLSRP